MKPSLWQRMGALFKGNLDILNYRSNSETNVGVNWTASQSSADSIIKYNLWQLRDKSRVMEAGNPIAERIFQLWESNTFGADGFTLQMQVKQETPITLQGGTVVPAGAPDSGANLAIENAYYDFWTMRGHCDVSGEMTGLDLSKLVFRSTARDGAVPVRLIRGFDNEWGFALQPLEIDQLDLNYNTILPNGNEVRMSVEVDKWGRRIAAWITDYQPGDWEKSYFGSVGNYQKQTRIPLEGFQGKGDNPALGTLLIPIRKRRPGQTLDLPWLTPVIDVLNSLSKYEEAELVAARAAAEKHEYFTRTADAEEYTGEKDGAGNFVIQSVPGLSQSLPVGWDVKPVDPKHPNGNYGDFRKNMLRSIASGVGMSYGSVANDRSDSSFSAERTALTDEREQYRMLQRWFSDQFMQPVFSAWLKMALLSGQVKLENGSTLPSSKFDKFNKPYFQGRRWGYINPLQDAQAFAMLRDRGWMSDRQIIAAGGGYIEDTYSEIRQDADLAEGQNGERTLTFGPQPKPMPERQTPQTEPKPGE